MSDEIPSNVHSAIAMLIAVAICAQPACSPPAEPGRLTLTLRCQRAAADGFLRLSPTIHNGTQTVVPVLVGTIEPNGEARLASSLVLRVYRAGSAAFEEYHQFPRRLGGGGAGRGFENWIVALPREGSCSLSLDPRDFVSRRTGRRLNSIGESDFDVVLEGPPEFVYLMLSDLRTRSVWRGQLVSNRLRSGQCE